MSGPFCPPETLLLEKSAPLGVDYIHRLCLQYDIPADELDLVSFQSLVLNARRVDPSLEAARDLSASAIEAFWYERNSKRSTN